MQEPCISNFRARLRKAGYDKISIKKAKQFINQQIYFVVAYDPFCYLKCERYMSIGDMCVWR